MRRSVYGFSTVYFSDKVETSIHIKAWLLFYSGDVPSAFCVFSASGKILGRLLAAKFTGESAKFGLPISLYPSSGDPQPNGICAQWSPMDYDRVKLAAKMPGSASAGPIHIPGGGRQTKF